MTPEEYDALTPEEREQVQRDANAAAHRLADVIEEATGHMIEALRDMPEELSIITSVIAAEVMGVGREATILRQSADAAEKVLDEKGIEGAEQEYNDRLEQMKRESAQSGSGIIGPGGTLL